MKYLKVTKDREVNTYADLSHTAWCLKEKGKEAQEGSYHQFLASLIFSAFTIEAYLNHLGAQLFGCWEDLERLEPLRKLNLIAEAIGLTVVYSRRPWQTISRLMDLRNQLAHGRTVRVEETIYLKDHPGNEQQKYDFALTDWEAQATEHSAERADYDVDEAIRIIQKQSGVEDLFLLNGGPQSSSSEIVDRKGANKRLQFTVLPQRQNRN